jgi:Protein of unknown function (DUF2934)
MTRDGREQAVIRERAFAIWEEEGRPEGKSVAHWLRAEAEIKPNKISLTWPIGGGIFEYRPASN